MWKKILLITVCFLTATVAGFSQIIPAIPVIDAGAIAELVSSLAQAVAIYNQAVTTYNQMKQQALYLANANAWKTQWKTWRPAGGADTYARNGGFLANINGALGAINGSLRRYPDFGGVLPKLHPATQDRIQWQYASGELHDDVAGYMLDVEGEIHSNDQTANITSLDEVVFATDDADNTAVQEAHKTAIATQIAAHQNEDVKRLLSVLAAQQALDLKYRRDGLEQMEAVYQEWLQRSQAGEPLSYVKGASAQIDAFVF